MTLVVKNKKRGRISCARTLKFCRRVYLQTFSNSYTMGFPPERGDNSRASHRTGGKHDTAILYTTLISVDLVQYEIFCKKFAISNKGSVKSN